ncbi:MAG: formyltransferase family protein [Planctomycetota bacterium]|nr:formyltransferase family protein [Planctomycetota bacterium]
MSAAPLSIVLFAAESMTRRYPLRWLRIVLCKRLLDHPKIEIKGLFIDKAPAKKAKSAKSFIKKYGEETYQEYLAAQQTELPDTEGPFDYSEECRDMGIPYFELDLNSEDAREAVATLAPDLGLLFGCRILKEGIISEPRFGTLNFHARDAEKFRGGGALGYWELLEGLDAVQITIHKAVAKVDAGAILARSRLAIEDCDTLESLLLKTVMRGVEFYARTVLAFASGQRNFVPQLATETKTYRRNLVAETIYRKKREQVLLKMPRYRGAALPSLWADDPGLGTKKNGVLVLAYPAIANNSKHSLNLPFEVFVGQLQWLKRYIPVLSLAGAVSQLGEKTLAQRSVVITLDGGFKQDMETVLPCLDAFEMAATYFLSPACGDEQPTLCGQALMDENDIQGLGKRQQLDFGLLQRGHFAEACSEDPLGTMGFDERFRAQLRTLTGREVEWAAVPSYSQASTADYSGLLVDDSGEWNIPESFNEARIHRVPAPSSVRALAELFECK